MGQRFRLKASFNTSTYPYQARVILDSLKKYGMIVADNSVDLLNRGFEISGACDTRWNMSQLNSLNNVKVSDFEAVNESSLMIDENSGQARIS